VTVCQRLASKPLRWFLPIWPQTPWRWFLLVWPQNQWRRFLLVWPQNRWWRVFRFRHQNHRDGFLVWASKPIVLRFVSCASKSTEDEDGVGHASRSSSLLHVEASQARVFRSGLKTSGGAMEVVHVAPSQRSRKNQVEDGHVDAMGHVGLCYPCFIVFFVFCRRGNLIF
jgi:hypothetical protein